jgi:hypothetical protein
MAEQAVHGCGIDPTTVYSSDIHTGALEAKSGGRHSWRSAMSGARAAINAHCRRRFVTLLNGPGFQYAMFQLRTRMARSRTQPPSVGLRVVGACESL